MITMLMTQEQIIEGNKLIAEFMGLKMQGDIAKRWHKQWFDEHGKRHERLYYDISWDWLMSVVEKIESLGFWTEIVNSCLGTTKRPGPIIWCQISKENHTDLLRDDNETVITRTEASIKIVAVYQAVTQFIRWYNENKTL